jgi:hypothetical protein
MKNFLIALFLIILSTNGLFSQSGLFSSKPDNYAVESQNYLDFIPIAPIQINANVVSLTSDSEIVNQSPLEMSIDKTTVLNFIPNESMKTTIQRFNKDGSVSYLYSGKSVKKGTYRLIIDYNKYIIQPVDSPSEAEGNCVGYAKVGVGLRIVVSVSALKNNIDISSLVALGNAAKENNISGSVGYEVLGVESKEITAVLPINAEITPSVNQVFLQAIGIVKAKIYDDSTRLYPQVIAIKHSGCDLKTITRNLIGKYSIAN